MKWKVMSRLIALPYTFFSLPWLIISVLLAFADPVLSVRISAEPKVWLWMLVAFLSARIAGMCFNRLIDHTFDQANPRTQDRVLVTGEASRTDVSRLTIIACALFVVACAKINDTCLILAPATLILLWGYSYLKRVTPWCQLVMALNHALIPVFVWAALTERIGFPAIVLGMALWGLFAAADIIYGIQDLHFDRAMNLHSFATAFGPQQAMRIAWVLQGGAFCLLWELGFLLSLGWPYALSVTLAGGLIALFDSQVDVDDSSTIQKFLGRSNSWIGVLLLVGVTGSRLYG